jgi:hypothetical protein
VNRATRAAGNGAGFAALAFAATLACAPAFAEGAPISVSGSAGGWISRWEDRGSAFYPEGSAADYAGRAEAELHAEAGERSRCAFEGSLSIDAASGLASFSARELWAEWRPAEALALRLGRHRLGFGSGFGWNPSNDLDGARYATDPTAPRIGADAALLRFEAGGLVGFPLSLSLVGTLPKGSSGASLADGRAAAQVYALAGDLEIMFAGSLSDLGGDGESWLAGGWMTLPVGPVILGIEGSARKRSDLFRPDSGGLPVIDREVYGSVAATATLKAGDFLVIAEGYWNPAAYTREEFDRIAASTARTAFAQAVLSPGSVGEWHALGRVMWGSGDWSAALGAVVDLETGAFAASADAALALRGEATLALKAAIPADVRLLERDELGLSGRGWQARASVSVNF